MPSTICGFSAEKVMTNSRSLSDAGTVTTTLPSPEPAAGSNVTSEAVRQLTVQSAFDVTVIVCSPPARSRANEVGVTEIVAFSPLASTPPSGVQPTANSVAVAATNAKNLLAFIMLFDLVK